MSTERILNLKDLGGCRLNVTVAMACSLVLTSCFNSPPKRDVIRHPTSDGHDALPSSQVASCIDVFLRESREHAVSVDDTRYRAFVHCLALVAPRPGGLAEPGHTEQARAFQEPLFTQVFPVFQRILGACEDPGPCKAKAERVFLACLLLESLNFFLPGKYAWITSESLVELLQNVAPEVLNELVKRIGTIAATFTPIAKCTSDRLLKLESCERLQCDAGLVCRRGVCRCADESACGLSCMKCVGDQRCFDDACVCPSGGQVCQKDFRCVEGCFSGIPYDPEACKCQCPPGTFPCPSDRGGQECVSLTAKPNCGTCGESCREDEFCNGGLCGPSVFWADFPGTMPAHGVPTTVPFGDGSTVDVTVTTGGTRGIFAESRGKTGSIETGLNYSQLRTLTIFNGGGSLNVTTTITFSNFRLSPQHQGGYIMVGAVNQASSPLKATREGTGSVESWTAIGDAFPLGAGNSAPITWASSTGSFETHAPIGNDSRGIVVSVGKLSQYTSITLTTEHFLDDGIVFSIAVEDR